MSKSNKSNTSLCSSYLNYRHDLTIRYLEQIKNDKEEQEKKELQKRNYLSKYSKQLINQMQNKSFLSSKFQTTQTSFCSFKSQNAFNHDLIRKKAKKRIIDNFINGFSLSQSLQFDITEARKAMIQQKKDNNNKSLYWNNKDIMTYREICPNKRIDMFYQVALNKKDNFIRQNDKKENRKKSSQKKNKKCKSYSYANSYRNKQNQSLKINKDNNILKTSLERKKDAETFSQYFVS